MLRVMINAELSAGMMTRTTFIAEHVPAISEGNLRALNSAIKAKVTGKPVTLAPVLRTSSVSPMSTATAQFC